MKVYTIWFNDCDGNLGFVDLEAESETEVEGYTLLWWVSDTYGIDYGDVDTDGIDVWYERDGKRHVIMKNISIEEAE